MAEPLKNHFGADVPATLAAMILAVHPRFPVKAFLRDALDGYEDLSLTARGWHLARVLRQHLPDDYPNAIAVLLASTSQPVNRTVATGMGAFLFMPHCFFVAEFGLDHFEASMQAQYVLTQRFTAEFSIRPYLIHHPEATLKQLRQWAADPSEHVRRLVSEGTRPRLPWAMRLPAFQADPAPVIELLELLKDDPALYVRRSVANNLNDIGKDNPAVLAGVAQRWLKNATPEREWIVRHALRWAVKQGDPAALKVLGFGKAAQVQIRDASITPKRSQIGGAVTIAFDIHNPLARAQDLMVDLAVHYVKAGGKTSAKVFKLKALNLAAGETAGLHKKLSLAQMTTRKHFAGLHRVEAIVNGQAFELGYFAII
jgi:3-methyladenine DNA glycosylase AlkC